MSSLRRFNYTRRERINKENIVIYLVEDNSGIPAFKAAIDLSPYSIPQNAKVYVEAYYKTTVMRFEFGKVYETALYAEKIYSLSDIQSNKFYFRVKVVDESHTMGQLIAVADKIDPITVDYDKINKLSLLHVTQENLGNRIWRLELDGSHGMPELVVNDSLELEINIQDIVRTDHAFMSLVFPQVIHEILSHILFHEDDVDVWDEDNWMAKWVQYSKHLTNIYMEVDVIEDLNEADKNLWITQVVEEFCRSQNIARIFESYVNQGK